MRYTCAFIVTVVLLCTLTGLAGAAGTAERPLAALIPADAGSYVEMNFDQLLGRTTEAAALGQAVEQMKSPALLKEMVQELLTDEPEAEQINLVLAMLGDLSSALGPRIGYAAWMPDAGSLMGAMMAGKSAGPGDMNAALGMMPKLLLVADLRDGAKLDRLLGQVTELAGVELTSSESNGVKTMTVAGVPVALARGNDWLAVGFPAELTDKAVARIAGTASDSLWDNSMYQRAISRLPANSMWIEYISPTAMRQLMALMNMMAPGLAFPPVTDEPLASGTGLRVEEVKGAQMVTLTTTMDLRELAQIMDASLAMQATIYKPILMQQKEQSRRQAVSDQCGEQLGALAEAMQSYLDEHEGRYPAADTWVSDLRPYLEDASVLTCPEESSGAVTSYGMNAALAGKLMGEVADPEMTVLFYETLHPGDCPSGGVDDIVDPARHVDGNNFAFVDGSIGAFQLDDEWQPVWDPTQTSASEDEETESEEDATE